MDKKYCTHDNLDLIKVWQGGDDSGNWELDVVCVDCGESCFTHDWIIDNFKLVRKGAS